MIGGVWLVCLPDKLLIINKAIEKLIIQELNEHSFFISGVTFDFNAYTVQLAVFIAVSYGGIVILQKIN